MMISDRGGLIFEPRVSFPPLPVEAMKSFAEWRNEGRLGFMQLPFQRDLEAMSMETASSMSGLVDDVVVDGIGGSALGLRCLLSALMPVKAGARIHIADSPDSDTVDRIKASCDPSRTLLVVITKSGSTAETMSVFLSFYEWLPEQLRETRVVAVTDPSSGDLRRLASDRGWPSLPVPVSVGGRYSVLSPVGLLPAALAGLDTQALLDGAASIVDEFDRDGMDSLPVMIASCWLSFFRTHSVHVFFVYSDRLFDTASWFAQLWAESLGKISASGDELLGQTPLACRGPADQHSLVQLFMEGPRDKFFTFLEAGKPSGVLCGGFDEYPSLKWLEGRTLDELRSAEASATAAALGERGLPVCRLVMDSTPSGYLMGKLLQSLEIATVLTGLSLGINPLDQPGVERGKYLTFKQMGRSGWK